MSRLVSHLVLILAGAAVAQLSRPVPVTAQTALLEVDKGEINLMQVNDDGGLVVRGGQTGAIPASGDGFRLMWHPAKAAFRAGAANGGSWDEANVGRTSVAMGAHTTASGEGSTALGIVSVASGRASTAIGDVAKATGPSATAIGSNTTASGADAVAMGDRATASGVAAVAVGERTTASGTAAVALGQGTRATGDRSTALGSNALASGHGSFAYGDASTNQVVGALLNMFAVRASGGFRFRTSPNESTGCDLQSGSGTFNCTSSRLAKERFEDLDGDAVLERLAAMPIQRWRYRGTETAHVGPTAEDFHAAFQLGEGPTTISTVDADGISLVAVQALERRTVELKKENAALRAKLVEDTAVLRSEIEALRRLVETGRVVP